MNEDLIHRGLLFLAISALSYWGYRWMGLSRVSELSPPVVLDPDSLKDQQEARCIDEQNRSGRELPGYKWEGGPGK